MTRTPPAREALVTETRAAFTPGPWDYVPSTEHHGPYVTSDHGGTICDCYVMSHPAEASTANGGRSKPIPFFHEMADPNARLIAAAPDLAESVSDLLKMVEAAHRQLGMWTDKNPRLVKARAALSKATGGA